MTTIIRTKLGFGIEINGELVADGFLNERSANRANKEAEAKYSRENDPDYLDFRAYNEAVAQVKFWKGLRSEIGETSSVEDIAATSADRAESLAQADSRIDFYAEEANKHLSGAKRWAKECRVELEIV